MEAALRELAWERSGGTCEYCRMPQVFDPLLPFQIDHVIAEKHGGPTVAENLALACLHCNRYKGPNVAGVDPLSGEVVRLFHPRRDRWAEHFGWSGPVLEGRTPIGRVTIQVLNINHLDLVAVRRALIDDGVFPPR